jgi:hypothetical protein
VKGVRRSSSSLCYKKKKCTATKSPSRSRRSARGIIENRAKKEIIIWVICWLAGVIGPGFLSNAHFQPTFIIAPLFLLFFCSLIYHTIVRRVAFPILWLVAIPLAYIFLLFGFFPSRHMPLTLENYISSLFRLDWNQYMGSAGIFEFPSLHLLWLILILWSFSVWKKGESLWRRLEKASFEYWMMVVSGIIIAYFHSTGEGQIFAVNVFLVYGFLQQIINPYVYSIWKQKAGHWLRSLYPLR